MAVWSSFGMIALLFVFATLLSDVSAETTACTFLSLGNSITASCNNLQLTSVPPSVPDNVTRLFLSHNNIRNITGLNLSRFQRLQVLDLSYNAISNFDISVFDHLEKLQELNLTHNNISEVACFHRERTILHYTQATLPRHKAASGNMTHISTTDDGQSVLKNLCILHLDNNVIASLNTSSLAALSSLTTLTLSHNLLKTVRNDTFQSLPRLQILNLCCNGLLRLEQRAFRRLTHLQTLHLSSNKLQYTESSLPLGVFVPVGDSLKSLYLHDNDIDIYHGSYPETVFMDLSALELLKVDTFARTTFGKGFAAMRQLSTLDLSHKCHLRSLTNDTFLSFANGSLQTLLVTFCYALQSLDSCTFCPLKYLSNLLLYETSNRQTGLNDYLKAFYGLQHRNLTAVNLERVSFQTPTGTSLNEHSLKYVLNTCVSHLNLKRNQITSIGKNGFGRKGSIFTQCIQSIDLSNNRIWYTNYLSVIQFLGFSPRLESVQVQLQREFNLETARYSMGNKKGPVNFHRITLPLRLKITPTLSFLNISGAFDIFGFLPDGVAIEDADNLKTFDLSYIGLYDCWTKFEGLEQLETLNISGNNCRKTSVSFFDAFTGLKTLIIQEMNFDPLFIVNQGARVFTNLTYLECLDLSYNDLGLLPSDLLYAQAKLQKLLLAGNKLSRLSLDIHYHSNLTLLDLSDNAISQLTDKERSSLNGLVALQSRPFHLRLHGNTLACTCDTLSFVRWLRFTQIRLDQNGDYPCVTDSGHLSSTAIVADHWELVWRHCVGPTVLWAAVAGMLVLLSLIGAVWGVAANATRLQFLLRVLWRIKMPRREEFLKDAYIAYCDADTEYVCTRLKQELQDQRGVRLLIKDLPQDEAGTQFWQLPGDNVAEKMLDHIDLCWKVLLVLTPALAHDPMAGFMTRAALQSISDRMPDRVLLLCVGVRHVPALASLRALLDTVSENQVIFVPADQHHPAWDRIAEIIFN